MILIPLFLIRHHIESHYNPTDNEYSKSNGELASFTIGVAGTALDTKTYCSLLRSLSSRRKPSKSIDPEPPLVDVTCTSTEVMLAQLGVPVIVKSFLWNAVIAYPAPGVVIV